MLEGIADFDFLTAALKRIFDFSQRISVWPLLSALAIAIIVFRRQFGARRASLRRFWRFLFPAKIWLHRSTGVDLKVAICGAIASPVRKFALSLTVASASVVLARTITHFAGQPSHSMDSGAASVLTLGVIIFLLTDFSTFLIHYLSHRWPILWAFHRVHHSAQVLNPITVARNHPIYPVLGKLLDFVIVAPVQGVAMYFWPEATAFATAVVVRWVYGIFALAGSNLRHSQLWFSFGPLERFLVSPAQHQIHHSMAEEHRDRNLGEVLAIWDWMFGTLIIAPRKRLKLAYGLAGEGQPHNGLWQALTEPFTYAGRVVKTSIPSRSRPLRGSTG